MIDKLGEGTFVTEGFNNWKKAIERFERHARSGLHKEATLKVQYLNQPGIDAHLHNQHLAALKVRRENLDFTFIIKIPFKARIGYLRS